MADADSAYRQWDDATRARVRAVRVAAERKWGDPDVSVSEIHGLWRIRSLNELQHPEPYWVGTTLEGAEVAVAKPPSP